MRTACSSPQSDKEPWEVPQTSRSLRSRPPARRFPPAGPTAPLAPSRARTRNTRRAHRARRPIALGTPVAPVAPVAPSRPSRPSRPERPSRPGARRATPASVSCGKHRAPRPPPRAARSFFRRVGCAHVLKWQPTRRKRPTSGRSAPRDASHAAHVTRSTSARSQRAAAARQASDQCGAEGSRPPQAGAVPKVEHNEPPPRAKPTTNVAPRAAARRRRALSRRWSQPGGSGVTRRRDSARSPSPRTAARPPA